MESGQDSQGLHQHRGPWKGISCGTISTGAAEQKTHSEGGERESVMNENDNMSHLEMLQAVGISDEGKSYIENLFLID